MIVDMLVDVVSKNGNLMLNFPLPSDGMLDDRELKILSEITAWMDVNSEAVHGTRPWKFSPGEPPGNINSSETQFNESKRTPLTASDVRFTCKKDTLYAFVMGWPQKQAIIPNLSATGPCASAKIERIELLGYKGPLNWTRDDNALRIVLPEQKPCDAAIAFRISGVGINI